MLYSCHCLPYFLNVHKNINIFFVLFLFFCSYNIFISALIHNITQNSAYTNNKINTKKITKPIHGFQLSLRGKIWRPLHWRPHHLPPKYYLRFILLVGYTLYLPKTTPFVVTISGLPVWTLSLMYQPIKIQYKSSKLLSEPIRKRYFKTLGTNVIKKPKVPSIDVPLNIFHSDCKE